jgi:hypothetical protein
MKKSQCWVDGPRRHHCAKLAGDELGQQRRPSVMHATMIGLDIAKTVFQVYGEDSEARAVLRKRLSRTALVRDNVAAGGSPGRLANGDRIVSVLRCAPAQAADLVILGQRIPDHSTGLEAPEDVIPRLQ